MRSLVAKNYSRLAGEFRSGDADDFPGLDWAVRAGDRVLDLGCGAGGSLDRFDAYQSVNGWRCGLDIADGMLKKAREAARDAANRRVWVLGDAVALPFSEQSFDFVISANALSRRDRLETVYAEIRRIVTPNGGVALKFRDARLLERPVEVVFRRALRDTLPERAIDLANMYEPASLEEGIAAARAVGFRVRHVSSMRIDREVGLEEAVERFGVVAGYILDAVDERERSDVLRRVRELLEVTARGGRVVDFDSYATLFLQP